ncbi:HigA family addiction module antidote protein [Aerophototrophica crusticola]|uniref:HigA family addiction module antidote protein n=1 Tax=Aerophototrophica crusticola TaxID=1709002 RepID=A0A858R928_9PROT|nr:HigA family addiction module antidote protein [Rhodospirillaceae bacterium B3]
MIGPTPPIHPGEILTEEFLKPMGLTASALARTCKASRTRIERFALGQTPVTGDLALRLGRVFRTGPEFWMNLQALHDLTEVAAIVHDLDGIEPLVPA